MPRKPLYALLREPAPPSWTPTIGDRVAVPLYSTRAVSAVVVEVFLWTDEVRVEIPVLRHSKRVHPITDVRPIPAKEKPCQKP